MDATLLRANNALIEATPRSTAGTWQGFMTRLLEAMVHASAERLPSPDRELPPEWFHYPLP